MIPIYHLNASIIKRTNARGQQRSVVAKAAYRAGERLYDEHYERHWNFENRADTQNSAAAKAAYRAGERLQDQVHGKLWDFSRKPGVAHSEISLPEWAPGWMGNRERLWNAIDGAEKRYDAQLSREIKVGLPNFFTLDQNKNLLREFIQKEFVAKGMIADWSIHTDNPNNLHAHILLTTREVAPEHYVLPPHATHEIKNAFKHGFLGKGRSWNYTSTLVGWREAWAVTTNEHLAEAGYAVRIDHRSYKDQGIRLIPGRKIGVGLDRHNEPDLPAFITDRIKEQERIQAANGEKIINDPTTALDFITHGQSTFTNRDIAKFLHTHTQGAEQFERAYLRVTVSPELVPIAIEGKEKDEVRYTTREMLGVENELTEVTQKLAARQGHGVSEAVRQQVLSRHPDLTPELKSALEHIVKTGDLALVKGIAGGRKSNILGPAREMWERTGYRVRGYALTSIAAQNMAPSGMPVNTLRSLELQWANGRNLPGPKDIIVIDESAMAGERMSLQIAKTAEERGAKVVMIRGDRQLDAIEAGAAHRHMASLIGEAHLTTPYRQKVDWQKGATEFFYNGQTEAALKLYEDNGRLIQTDTRERAKSALLAQWAKDGEQHPEQNRLILAYTNQDVFDLNQKVHALRRQRGELGDACTVETATGKREFSVGDRILFRRRDKRLGVANGSLGTIEAIKGSVLTVKLDTPDGTEKRISVDTQIYKDIDLGYAATIHKAQGSTLDRVYVLATDHFDSSASYVALSRHEQDAYMFYAAADFGVRDRHPEAADLNAEKARKEMMETLSRHRSKDRAHDYIQEKIDKPAPPKRLTATEQFLAGLDLDRELSDARHDGLESPAEPIPETSAEDLFKVLEADPPQMLAEFGEERLRRQDEKEWEKEARQEIERTEDPQEDFLFDFGIDDSKRDDEAHDRELNRELENLETSDARQSDIENLFDRYLESSQAEIQKEFEREQRLRKEREQKELEREESRKIERDHSHDYDYDDDYGL